MNQAPLWQTLSAAETAVQLGVDPERGLTPEQVTERLSQYGRNTLPEAVPPSLWTLIWRQLKSFIVVVLLSAAVLSAALGELGDALAIFAALLINIVVGLLMDFRAERDIASLRSLSSPKARVRRDGHEVELSAAEVLPGDVVLLRRPRTGRRPPVCRGVCGR